MSALPPGTLVPDATVRRWSQSPYPQDDVDPAGRRGVEQTHETGADAPDAPALDGEDTDGPMARDS